MWSPPIPWGPGPWQASSVPGLGTADPQVCREGSCREKAVDNVAGKRGGSRGRAGQPGGVWPHPGSAEINSKGSDKGKMRSHSASWKGGSERRWGHACTTWHGKYWDRRRRTEAAWDPPLGLGQSRGSGTPRMGRRKGVRSMGWESRYSLRVQV